MNKPDLPQIVHDIAGREIVDRIETKRGQRRELEAKLTAASLELMALEDELSRHSGKDVPQTPVVVEIRTTETHYVSIPYLGGREEARPARTYAIACSDIHVAYIASIAFDPAPPMEAINSTKEDYFGVSIERTVVLAKCGELEVVLRPSDLAEDKQLTHAIVTKIARDVADSFKDCSYDPENVHIVRRRLLQYCYDTDSTFKILPYTDTPCATDYGYTDTPCTTDFGYTDASRATDY